ncbi:hypothetical protein FOC4_g10002634 [Fusarium odoratissimum]|uniref:Uncharacterized protein n=1 Tax=Fusarium oxysporum f. sp. cubense (strain race 4) TaxID=2502994 RepID=N1SAE6_FUSC4|nr:hypothetical protein FOC4_g10002634 [Fusarium odoratissimum]
MRHWISQCQQKHIDRGLRPYAVVPWYPTRLQDLGDPKSISVPRLIETATNLPKGPYLTVSHCRGKSKHICATTNNLNIEHSRAEGYRAGKIYPARKLRRQLNSMSRLLIDFLLA